MRHVTFLTVFAAFLLGGCSLISTTTDTTAQLAEGITNATASTSDGISGQDPAEEAALARASRFVGSQWAFVRRDAAAGHGENLDALARLLGEPDHAAFGHWMQTNYQSLFDVERSPRELVDYVATQRS